MSLFQSLFKSLRPTVRAEEEEIIDPKEVLTEKCREEAKCQKYNAKLQECTDRVSSKKQTAETCAEELYDFIHCVDHCVSHDLFSKLK